MVKKLFFMVIFAGLVSCGGNTETATNVQDEPTLEAVDSLDQVEVLDTIATEEDVVLD